ncbi:CAP domain-containing protein [Zychaea mexicana]|uniref:CAP domain-containing protein n=1 Tax=Zychaea mexicana TaxID=64656 RepID=UPI0022FE8A72|nr:CAP domain-containing protein [Zychaea mexicana]KAI9490547.1 CAP domain-containing protein [Zychaea mexicana]
MRPIPLFITILVLSLIQVTRAISSATAKSALKIHNEFRAKHSAPALKWSTTLEKYAQSWANKCDFKHTNGPYGENLAWGYANFPAAISAWYNEEEKYDYNNPGFSGSTGHFTQVVWKSTTELGCGIKTCPDGAKNYVCSYKSPGNVVSSDNAYFKKNVLPK